MTRASTPASLSTSTVMVWLSRTVEPVSFSYNMESDHRLSGFGDFRLAQIAQDHLVMRRAGRDHREDVLRRIDAAVEQHRAFGVDHLHDLAVQFRRLLGAQTETAKGLRHLDEIGQR